MKMKTTDVGKTQIKILFKVSGGAEIGMGHIRRSLALAQFLNEKMGTDSIFHCNKIDLGIIQNNYTIPFFFTPLGTDDGKFIAGLIRDNDINIVVMDEVNVDESICKAIKNTSPSTRIVALDHFDYSGKHLDIIINLLNQNVDVPDPSRVFHGRYEEGVRYAIIRGSLSRRADHTKKHPLSPLLKIVLTFGGSDVKGHTFEILRLLSKIDLPFSTCVILGPLFREPERIIRIAKDLPNCSVLINPNDYDDQIMSADLGFIGGGTTMLEFCSAGVPAIVVPQNVAELRFASVFERNEAVITLKDTYSEDQKVEIITKMIQDKDLRRRMSAAQDLMIDTNGKGRISELILSGLD